MSNLDNEGLYQKLLNVLQSGNVYEFNKLWELNGRPRLDLRNKKFLNLNLDGVSLTHSDLEQSDFTGASLEEANLEDANLLSAKLDKVYLRSANLKKANLSGTSAKEVNLMHANLDQARLAGAILKNAKLDGASLVGAYLHETSLEGASLIGSKLDAANFEFADLSNADLTRASARNCSFKLAKFDSTKLLETDITGSTDLPIKISEAKSRGARLDEKPPEQILKKVLKKSTKDGKEGVLKKGSLSNYDSIELYPDDPTDEDSLSRSSLAELLAHRMIKVRNQNPTGSFIVNLDGPWGSGKSSFLKLLKKELHRSNVSQKRELEWIVVEFNAWQNQRIHNPWWSLMDSVWRQSSAYLLKNNFPRYIKMAIFQAIWRSKLSRGRFFAFTTFILFLTGMIVLFSGLDFSDITKLTESGKQLIENIQKISGIVAVVASFISGILLLRNSLFPSTRSDVAELLKSFDDPMRRLTEHFTKYIQKIRTPIVVFIDDLDRCNEKYTVDFLEGLQTIFREANVIYVVAADKRWIHSAFEKTYASFLNLGEPGRPLGQLFLAKIFQMSVPIPKMSPDVWKDYFSSLLKRTKPRDEEREEETVKRFAKEIEPYNDNRRLIRLAIEKEGNTNDVQATRKAVLRKLEEPERELETERMLEKFTFLLEPNPRAIKRLLNTFVIYRAIAILKGMDLDFDKLALWTIISMRWPVLSDYLSIHPEDIENIRNESKIPNEIIGIMTLNKNEVLNVINGEGIGKSLGAFDIEFLSQAN